MFNYLRINLGNRRDEERVAIVEPADEEIKINYAAALVLLFIYTSFISCIVYGAIHLKDCPAENMLAISLIVIGSLGLLVKIITCVYDCQEIFGVRDVPKNTGLFCISALLCIILLCWFFAMCYWSFKIDPDTKPEDHDKPNYCLLEFYRSVYWTSIFGFVITGLLFTGICCVAFAAASET